MKSTQQTTAYPTELSIAGGIALALSNQWLVAIVAAILWFPLRRVRPSTPSTILLVTSVRLATGICALIVVAMGLVPWTMLIEVAVVTAVVLLMFFTGAAVWAYMLILHSAYVAVQHCFNLRSPDLTPLLQRSAIGTIALQLLIIWMLITYLRAPLQPTAESARASSPNENA